MKHIYRRFLIDAKYEKFDLFRLFHFFLFADSGEFARSTGQKIYHLFCMTIGLYTTVILLLPKG